MTQKQTNSKPNRNPKWVLLFLIIVSTLFVFNCGGGNKSNSDVFTNTNLKDLDVTNSPVTLYTSYKQQLTPNSPIVYSKDKMSDEFLGWIDESFNKLTSDINIDGRILDVKANVNSIYIYPDCVLSPEGRTPSFLISANDYDGTEYDSDPRPGIGAIYAAEYVLWNKNGTLANSWIICQSDDDQYVKNVTRYGREHKYLYDFYRQEYEDTKFHGNGIGHPLIKEY